MKILSETQLKALPTARLLALYRKNFKQMQSQYAWITDYGNAPEALQEDSEEVRLAVKLDKYCDRMKKILDTRGHVERKQ